MLVLTRRVGESIVIGDSITITVNEIKGGRAILGINAPKDLKVFRGELHANKAVSSGLGIGEVSPISPARIPTASDVDGFGVIAFPSGGFSRPKGLASQSEAMIYEANDAA